MWKKIKALFSRSKKSEKKEPKRRMSYGRCSYCGRLHDNPWQYDICRDEHDVEFLIG